MSEHPVIASERFTGVVLLGVLLIDNGDSTYDVAAVGVESFVGGRLPDALAFARRVLDCERGSIRCWSRREGMFVSEFDLEEGA